LYLDSYGYNPTALTRIVFAMDQLGDSELSPFDAPKPRMYESIGPVKDLFGQIMTIVRVTEVKKASEPEGVDYTYSTQTVRFEQDQEQVGDEIYSVKEKVIEDLKKLAWFGVVL